MKSWLALELSHFRDAAVDLQRAAPTPSGRGWSVTEDAEAIRQMKDAWGRARRSYELVEGAVAPLFPDSDTATDARYDDFMAALGPGGDPEPFDDRGVVGVHAIERVLWADSAPRETVAFESRLPGYRAAAFPATEAEARSFKDQLAAKLVTDIEQLQRQLDPIELDIAFAFRGLIDLTNEQIEKVDRAATGREESRYAQATLRDLRANREGCLAAYRLFQPWLVARGRTDLDAQVMAGFTRLAQAYDATPGAAIPRPPDAWSSLAPKADHLNTSFGKLFSVVRRETDDKEPGSLSHGLMSVADALGLPKAVLR
ncbi:MAG TPA: imelysin family protein [Polyangiaceae bacterium]|nr:imelysin family protein [Polyangiaceae bacterium]